LTPLAEVAATEDTDSMCWIRRAGSGWRGGNGGLGGADPALDGQLSAILSAQFVWGHSPWFGGCDIWIAMVGQAGMGGVR
jgi:hypothetical protein